MNYHPKKTALLFIALCTQSTIYSMTLSKPKKAADYGTHITSSKDEYDSTSLHQLVKHGKISRLKRSLESGSAVDKEDEKGWTALHYAAAHPHTTLFEVVGSLASSITNIITILLIEEYDAEIHLTDDTYAATPLHIAAWKGNTEVAEILLKHNASVNAQDKNGNTPLHVAQNEKIATALLANDASVSAQSKDGDTPLHVALNEQVATVLLTYNASLTITNKEQLIPIQTIAQMDNTKLLKFLLPKHTPEALEKGLAQYSESTPNILFWALRNDITREAIKQIINAFPQFIETTTSTKESPLHTAAMLGRKDVVKLLIARESTCRHKRCKWQHTTSCSVK